MNSLTFLLSGALGAFLAFIPAAQAQEVDSNQSSAAPMRMIPGVRYTTGAVTTAGWEKSLTDGDPNLKRWNWSAMTTYTQSSYNKIPAGAFLKKSNRAEQPALKPTGSIYVKPVQISADTYAKKRVQPGVIVLGGNNSNSNLSGRVRLPKQQIAQSAPVAKSYNVNYGVAGQVHLPSDESLASRQVHGRLIKTQ
ncbi:MAG: hypothetical protein K2X27_21460 [Candidatus Obscuribacterales bacterium]|nr:hypothetical protein [Candidatus Obscuribacterales bacterium]